MKRVVSSRQERRPATKRTRQMQAAYPMFMRAHCPAYWRLPAAMATAMLLSACEPSQQQRADRVESLRIECLDKICDGDAPPKHDSINEFAFKVNGQWFIAPREYGGYGGDLSFFWPSKTPVNRFGSGQAAPEFRPSSAGISSNFYAVAIEISLRSNTIPAEPRGFQLIQHAQAAGWILERRKLRSGLELIRMKPGVVGPRGSRIDHVTYYVATEIKGADGLPPVATCAHDRPEGSGGTGFMWQPGIWVGTRMNQRHCADWPEIYQEITRVLQSVRKA